MLAAVNRAVNRAIRPVSERPGHDRWRIAPDTGDCEDYALTKKLALMAKGWPAAELRFATVLTETAEHHAVLLVDSARGPMMLDNRSDRIRPLAEAERGGYVLLAVEGAGPGGAWKMMPEAAIAALMLSGGVLSSER